MGYAVKEIFYSLQGEGVRAGRPAVFCRFAGCNLWSGREADRSDAACTFCDTDFVGTDGLGGGKFADAESLARAVAGHWPKGAGGFPYVVLTGGEPALQADEALVDALHRQGFEVAIETNGTVRLPRGIDWICVSPKGQTVLAVTAGDELKLIYPQEGIDPAGYTALKFEHFVLQPKDGPNRAVDTAAALRYCLEQPRWRLSLQLHKILEIP